MNPIENWLNKLESKLQTLVEGAADRLTPSDKASVERRNDVGKTEGTAPMDIESYGANMVQPIPYGAFLVVDGVRMIPLTKAVMSIGRAPENDLVIIDQRVSRQHAQLRAVDGSFVIFDLDSTGGTILNGQPVVQHVLTPGDVILLAGVPLVYSQEGQAGSDFTKELEI
jgi:hypothetical protein